MSDFLSNLAARTLSAAPVIQPRPLTVFESWPTDGALGAQRSPDIAPGDEPVVETAVERTAPTSHVNAPAREIMPIESTPSRPMMAAPMTAEAIHAASLPARSDFSARPASPREPASTPPAVAALQSAPPIIDRRDEARRPTEPITVVERLTVEREQIDREPEKPPVSALTPQTDLAAKLAAPVKSPSIVQPVVERVIDRRADPAPQPSSDGRSSPTPAAAGHEAANESPAPPVIHVTIGRVEVRAAPPPAPPRRAPRATSALSLEDYLRSREGGRR